MRRTKDTPRKRQRTRWIFHYKADQNTGIRVGWIHNKKSGVPEDKIALQIKSKHGFWDFNIRLDEALAIIAGIGKVLAQQAINENIEVMDL